MTPETVARLEALNRRFYDDVADEFSATRRSPWPGWTKLMQRTGSVLSVLDAGCGNGRFRELAGDADYLGVDTAEALMPDGPSFLAGDIHAAPWGTRRFELVVAFGVMHHVPSNARRLDLIRTLAAASDRWLVVTAWRFDPARAVDWSRAGVEASDVDEGDYVLPFGHTDALRYCHLASDSEVQSWIDASGFDLGDDFLSDGRDGASNRYLVLRR